METPDFSAETRGFSAETRGFSGETRGFSAETFQWGQRCFGSSIKRLAFPMKSSGTQKKCKCLWWKAWGLRLKLWGFWWFSDRGGYRGGGGRTFAPRDFRINSQYHLRERKLSAKQKKNIYLKQNFRLRHVFLFLNLDFFVPK